MGECCISSAESSPWGNKKKALLSFSLSKVLYVFGTNSVLELFVFSFLLIVVTIHENLVIEQHINSCTK